MLTRATTQPCSTDRQGIIRGCLLGMAVGDALGLPREGLTSERGRKLFGGAPLRHQLVFGRGMISDDTEHACLTAQALLAADGDLPRFQSSLAWRLRFWLLGIPAGIGWGTLRAILKLWIGVPPAVSGVGSAGNGPAMRAPIVGVLLADQPAALSAFVAATTRITHRELRAEQGALAIAIAAADAAARTRTAAYHWRDALERIRQHVTDEELLGLLRTIENHLEAGGQPQDLADELGLSRGVTGYIYHTVPIALFCWLRYLGDYRTSVSQAILLGGDTDTVAAITGALAGITAGPDGIPLEWIDGLIEWPRSVRWMEQLTTRLAEQFPEPGHAASPVPQSPGPQSPGPQSLFWPGQLARNLCFATIVLGHGLRRLLPPY